ncbi:metal binding domain of Ada-domain-containing protein [Hypoxylon trugodes]|uniref:metal binding domain of Ada-domain-containing protein n=1 Tax=Hypoxylon trugodes TaxID=326681 RepID=UPI0021914AAE|nr:metal binding domain of Ada-domain-containing protein [Hypoxylon trugodes]KAI1385799.1 metal binding domain of Ada-domain-containing protein [Hypoxylon trugodes]
MTNPSRFATETARWNAVQARDPAADGMFVYAVRTTKIYCRPVCKSRRARRANVSFYTTCQDAERAGFRPCKRCKPEVRGGMPEEAAVARVRSLVEQSLWRFAMEPDGQSDVSDTTGELAQKAQVSKWHFHRVFKEMMGMTPAEYANQQKALRADYSKLGEETQTNTPSSHLTPNFTDTLGGIPYEEPNVDIDWSALINDDGIIPLNETVDFNEVNEVSGFMPILPE